MHPQVALVGRPNVGKSSLFNRISRQQTALVGAQEGITRDLLFELIRDEKGSFILIDAPGHKRGKQELDRLMARQAEKAWQTANLALLVCEPQLHTEDEHILAQLRHAETPCLVAVNKLDHQASEVELAEFHQCGVPVYGVSAHSGLGIKQLLETIRARLAKSMRNAEAIHTEEDGRTSISLLGRPNTGKSTLANRLLGDERQLVRAEAGTTRDSVQLDFSWRRKDYRLIDTAGVRKKRKICSELEKTAVGRALGSAISSQIVIVLLDASDALTSQDMALLQLVERLGKGLVIAVNKTDLLNNEEKKRVAAHLEDRLSFVRYADIRFISAAKKHGISPLMQSVSHAYVSIGRSWKTHQLNKTLRHCLAQQQPPMAQGMPSTPRYAHQAGTHPPRIVIHGKRLDRLPSHYKRFLQHCFSAELDLRGVPLQLQFKTDANPYG